jgi:hypothetical protein
MVRVTTPEEEDIKHIHRERENLVQERLRIEKRIEALLFSRHTGGNLTVGVPTLVRPEVILLWLINHTNKDRFCF